MGRSLRPWATTARKGCHMAVFGHVATAMATPFTEHESLDETGAATLARHLVDHGTETVVLVGTTGESPTLSADEVARLVAVVSAEVGDEAGIVLGAGTNSTARTVAACEAAVDMDVDGLLVVSPYGNRTRTAWPSSASTW